MTTAMATDMHSPSISYNVRDHGIEADGGPGGRSARDHHAASSGAGDAKP